MHITAHIVADGADAAAAFYGRAFGAQEIERIPTPDGRLMSVQLRIAGATVRQPLGDMFWGERHGQLEDPFGHRWNIGQRLREVPHEEVVAAAAQLFSK